MTLNELDVVNSELNYLILVIVLKNLNKIS